MKEAKRTAIKATPAYKELHKMLQMSKGMHSSQITLVINCLNISKILYKRKKIQCRILGQETNELHIWKVEEKHLTF